MSIIEILSEKTFITNVASQVVGYAFTAITNHPDKLSSLLPPICTHTKYVSTFVNEIPGPAKYERVANIALALTTTGCLTKNFNPGCNAVAGIFIYVLADYIQKMATTPNSGNIPFVACQ